jgi:hypothetical protein
MQNILSVGVFFRTAAFVCTGWENLNYIFPCYLTFSFILHSCGWALAGGRRCKYEYMSDADLAHFLLFDREFVLLRQEFK